MEAQAQNSGRLSLLLYTTDVERMALFYYILGFIVVEDQIRFSDYRSFVMALKENSGAQVCLLAPTAQTEHRIGKLFFSIASSTLHVTYQTLQARGFRLSEFDASTHNENFVAYDPEGNEVFVGMARQLLLSE